MSTPPTVPKFFVPEEAPDVLEAAIDSLKKYGLSNLAMHLDEVRENAKLGSFGRVALLDAIVTTRLHICDAMQVLDAAAVPEWSTGLGRVLPLLEGATRRLRAGRRNA